MREDDKMLKCKVLINFIEDINDEMLLLIRLFRPQEIVLVTELKMTPDSKIEQVADYIKMLYRDIQIHRVDYEKENLQDLEVKLKDYLKEDTAINLAGASPLEVLCSIRLSQVHDTKMLYPAITQNCLYYFKGHEIQTQVLSELIESLKVTDYLDLGGGQVLQDEKEKYETTPYKEMLNFLKDHYEDVFRDIHHFFKPTKVHYAVGDDHAFYFEILKQGIGLQEQEQLHQFFEALQKMNWVRKVEEDEKKYRVYSMTKEMEYYLTSGAWLEHITYDIMKQIAKDTHTGFKFAWQKNKSYIHNELDVVAVMDNHLICISCKDTDRYNYQTLNELMVYATRLGGKESIKVLVVTMPSYKASTFERAKGMGIHIVEFYDSIKSLEEQLRELV